MVYVCVCKQLQMRERRLVKLENDITELNQVIAQKETEMADQLQTTRMWQDKASDYGHQVLYNYNNYMCSKAGNKLYILTYSTAIRLRIKSIMHMYSLTTFNKTSDFSLEASDCGY